MIRIVCISFLLIRIPRRIALEFNVLSYYDIAFMRIFFIILPPILAKTTDDANSSPLVQVFTAVFSKRPPRIDRNESRLLNQFPFGISIVSISCYRKSTGILPARHGLQFRILREVSFNDNLPLIQDYPMQVFVVQTLNFLEFFQFFISF